MPELAALPRICAAHRGQLGNEFGKHPGVVAWQIDNEFWEDCYCDHCKAAFHEWLKRRYDTIDRLNEQWLTTLWSQTYQSFDQVPLPNPATVGGSHHPSLRLAYRRFMSDSYVSFCMEQARELRRHTAAPITTNGHNPRYQRIDYAELFRGLDVVGTDSYAGPNDLLRYAFAADWMRARPQAVLAGGNVVDVGGGHGRRRRHGFRLRQGRAAGQDVAQLRARRRDGKLLAVARALGRPGTRARQPALPVGRRNANTPEIREVAQELKRHCDWLRSTRPAPCPVAMHYGVPEQWQFEATGIAAGFDYDSAITSFHRMLAGAGIARDVIAPGHRSKPTTWCFPPTFRIFPRS